MPNIAIESSSWLRRFRPSPDARSRLICFPHAAGSCTYYFPFSRMLDPHLDVVAVQYPGRQERRNEKCLDSIDELARLIHRELADTPELAETPFAFFGHSMGATIAFEVARRMRTSPTRPAHLFVSGRRAPQCQRPPTMIGRSDDDLLAEIHRLGATDRRILDDPALRAVLLPVIRSDYRAIESYRYSAGDRLDCPITVLVGDVDPQTTATEAAAWREQSTAEVTVTTFAGGHFFLEHHHDRVSATISNAMPSV